MHARKGFTLVELLVVIAIIAVLLAILLPSLQSVKEMASRLRCGNSFKGIGMAIKFYGDNYDGKLPQLEYDTGTDHETQQHPYWAFRDASSADPTKWAMTINFGCLFKAALIQNPSTFYCPADGRWKDIMKSYATGGQWGEKVPILPVNDPSIADNPDPDDRPAANVACLRTNIAYFPQSKEFIKTAARATALQPSSGLPDFYEKDYPDIAYKIADLDSNKAYASDNGGHAIGGRTTAGTKGKGQNALFGDGHVIFSPPPKDATGTVYRIRQENEETTDVIDGVVPRTNRYFYCLQP
jgi:prepilin-type N-terminal cleavage/methylation domain-containing protein/prepilin-type processing-associated H-X9-DG protein